MSKKAMFAAVLAVAMAWMPCANASLILGLTDGSTSVIVIDDSPSATLSSGGSWTSTTADSNATAGVVSFSGSIGSFVVNVTTGISKPLIGATSIDLNSVNVSGGSGTLRMFLIDTDFFASLAGTRVVQGSIGGTTTGSVNYAIGGVLDSNAETGFSALTSLGPFSGGAFSGIDYGSAFVSGLFSMAMQIEITHTGAGNITSFDSMLQVIPEPGSLAVWALIGGLGLVCGRRRRRA
jgi:hypothetical protein